MKIVYLPIEQGLRESAGRAHLARSLALAGYHVVVARRRCLIGVTRFLAPGVFIDTNLLTQTVPTSLGRDILQQRQDRGVANFCMDEESFVVGDLHQFERTRLRADLLALLDRYLAVGSPTAAVVQKYLDPGSVILTGNPRSDLWQEPYLTIWSDQVEATRADIGSSYVLVVSSFAALDHMGGGSFFKKQLETYGWLEQSESRAFVESRTNALHLLRDRIAFSVQELLDQTSFSVVLRPHPAESHAFWETLSSKSERVHIRSEGPVSPWVFGSEAVLHGGSTVALEAFLASVPAVHAGAFDLDSEAVDVPSRVSSRLGSPSDVVAAILRARFSESERSKRWKSVSEIVRVDPGAASRVVASVDEFPEILSSRARWRLLLLGLKVENLTSTLRRGMATVRKIVVPKRLRASGGYGGTDEAKTYYRSRDRLTSGDELVDLVDRVGRLNEADRLKVRGRLVGRDVLVLSRAE